MNSRKLLASVFVLVTLCVTTYPVTVFGQRSNTSKPGYIESAVVANNVQFRFDAAYNNPFPDRAEFFYAKCGCFDQVVRGVSAADAGPGPPNPETSVDYQEYDTHIEFASSTWFSTFVEIPIRSINPDINDNATGLGDIRVGFKYALIADDDAWLTFITRCYFPTGEGDKGLGTEHVSIEPGLLFQGTTGRTSLFSEFKAWVPISSEQERFPNPFPGSTDPLENFAGTVLRYGVGLGYDLYQECGTNCCSPCCACGSSVQNRLTAIAEVVGWSVLDGLKFRIDPLAGNALVYQEAAGDTIVNLKLGMRWSTPRDTIYIGYGRALTDEIWYKDLLRAEYSFYY